MSPAPRDGFSLDERAPWGPDEERRIFSVTDWEPIDLDPVLRGEQVTAPPSVFERDDGIRLLYPGRLNLFMGETESGKSWIAMVAVKQELAAGHHVIYLDYEDSPEATVERLRALGATVEQIARHLTYINPTGRFDDLVLSDGRRHDPQGSAGLGNHRWSYPSDGRYRARPDQTWVGSLVWP